MPSFTAQTPNLRESGPVVEVQIAVGFALDEVLKQKGKETPTPVQVQAMIDTGATGTVVRNDLVRRLTPRRHNVDSHAIFYKHQM